MRPVVYAHSFYVTCPFSFFPYQPNKTFLFLFYFHFFFFLVQPFTAKWIWETVRAIFHLLLLVKETELFQLLTGRPLLLATSYWLLFSFLHHFAGPYSLFWYIYSYTRIERRISLYKGRVAVWRSLIVQPTSLNTWFGGPTLCHVYSSAAECYAEYKEHTVGGDVTNRNSPAQKSNEPPSKHLLQLSSVLVSPTLFGPHMWCLPL